MGVDIGTTSAKSVIVDESGKVISEHNSEYDVMTPYPGWAEQWPDVWLDAVLKVIKNSLKKSGLSPSKIKGIAISGLYGGSGVPVDENFEPLRPCIIWMDRRAQKETEWVKRNIPKDKIVSITGNYVDSYYGFTKILWIKNNEPSVWDKVYKFITPKDFVIYKLTGNLVIDHSSAGNLGGLYDLKERRWSNEMSEMLGIPVEKLPECIVKSTEIAGYLKKDFSSVTGLLEGTPVIAGGIDAPVAQLSAGSVDPGEQVVMLGTSMCWGTLHEGEYISSSLVNFPYVVDDDSLIYTFGGGATSGAIVKWFKDNFGGSYDVLNRQASEIPAGSEGLVVLPYFMGERSPIWDPKAKGMIFGLSLKHTRAHVYRAFLEGVAYSLRHNIEEAEKMGMNIPKKSFIVGGGAKSDLWVKILADVTGLDMVKVRGNVEAPLGDAFLSGLGIGVFKDKHEIKRWVDYEDPVVSEKQQIYEKLYEIYKDLYKHTKEDMWRLPLKYR